MKVKPSSHSGEVVLEMGRRDESLLASASNTPFTLKKILVPIDFSECSKKALRYAIPLAEQHGGSVILLYVVPALAFGGGGEYGMIDYTAIEAELSANAEKNMAALLVDEVRGKVPASAVVRTGSPAVEIAEFARTVPADIIVISTHGSTGLKHVLLGSVAERVVRHAPCPVLVVREHEHEFLAS